MSEYEDLFKTFLTEPTAAEKDESAWVPSSLQTLGKVEPTPEFSDIKENKELTNPQGGGIAGLVEDFTPVETVNDTDLDLMYLEAIAKNGDDKPEELVEGEDSQQADYIEPGGDYIKVSNKTVESTIDVFDNSAIKEAPVLPESSFKPKTSSQKEALFIEPPTINDRGDRPDEDVFTDAINILDTYRNFSNDEKQVAKQFLELDDDASEASIIVATLNADEVLVDAFKNLLEAKKKQNPDRAFFLVSLSRLELDNVSSVGSVFISAPVVREDSEQTVEFAARVERLIDSLSSAEVGLFSATYQLLLKQEPNHTPTNVDAVVEPESTTDKSSEHPIVVEPKKIEV